MFIFVFHYLFFIYQYCKERTELCLKLSLHTKIGLRTNKLEARPTLCQSLKMRELAEDLIYINIHG